MKAIKWPEEIYKIEPGDQIYCVGPMTCPYREKYHPIIYAHCGRMASIIRSIVKHYGFDSSDLPACVVLKYEIVNDLLKKARLLMGLPVKLPVSVSALDSVTSEFTNDLIFRCLIKPMEMRKRKLEK